MTRGKSIEDDPEYGSSEIARELSQSHERRWRCEYMGSEEVAHPGKVIPVSFLKRLRTTEGGNI